jgi:hypothetical protein
MTPFRLSQLKKLFGRRRARRRPIVNVPRLCLELLEDRVVPSSDPYLLYTAGDVYTGANGQNAQTFYANYQPFDPALGAPLVSPLGQPPGANDPGSLGSFAVTTQEYNLGNLAFRPTDSVWASSGTELTGEIKAPTDLGNTAHPVVVLLHGRHVTTYDPVTGGAALEWPATGTRVPIPSYRGYDYLGDVLASQGYVVVSIGANGINARDNNDPFPDLGMTARAQLVERTFGILSDLNRDGVIRPRAADATHPGTDLFTDASSPFGTRFVGKLDLQNIGLMGHSRGGEGVVRAYILNQALGSPYGIKAVFALAPVDFIGSTINNVPFAVLLPYNDGDVSDLQGAHFFDDSRYNVPGDTGPKFSIEVMGADHNFYNTVWSPGLFPFAGAPAGFGGTSDDGNSGPPSRLTEAQQQGTGLAYMSAFFRTYLGGETQFLPILTGDAPPPASATVAPDRIHIGYLPADDPLDRRDVNRLLTTANLTTNTLGGTVVTSGLTTPTISGPVTREVNRGNQLSLGYSNTLAAFYENDLPVGLRDERAYTDLQFRIGVNLLDTRNPLNMAQDFTVTLIDGAGMSFSTLVSAWSNDLFYPPQSPNPHEVLNTVRIPLSAFIGHIDLSDVAVIRFNFDQHNSGAFQIADLAFADPVAAAGPYVVSSTPSGNVLGAQNSVRVRFDRTIDMTTFTTDQIVSFTRTAGSTQTDLLSAVTGITPVAGSNDRQFDIAFQSQGLAGTYQLTIGPNILDLDGNPMDQNLNGVTGEDTDAYTATFVILGPSITGSTPTGNRFDPLGSVRVTFNEPVDPATFGTTRITGFTRTVGSTTVTDLRSAITGVTPVAGSNNTQFDITFASQSALGAYSLTVGTGVLDLAGNPTTADFTTSFSIQGPKIIAGTPSGTNHLPGEQINSATVTFNEPINPSTFTLGEVFAFHGPDGFHTIQSVTPVAGSNTQFRITFAPLSVTGTYTMLIGPDIRDTSGHRMDQNGNFIDGEFPDDTYALTFGIQGLKVTSSSLNSNLPGQAFRVHLTFNEPVLLSSLTTAAVSLSGPDGSHAAVAVVPTPGSNFMQFDVLFAPLTAAGTYTVTVAPTVADIYGNRMDQDNNLVPGESSDAYTNNFTLVGPQVTAVSPTGTVAQPVDHVRLTFNESINPSSFTLSQITAFTRTVGTTVTDVRPALTGVTPVPFTNNTQFDVAFNTQGANGSYALTLSAAVADAYGNPLGAPFNAQFTLAGGPHVTSFSPTGTVSGPVDHVRVTFDRTIDVSTFTSAQVTFNRGGTAIPVTGVVEVAGSNHTQFDVTFASQSGGGSYSLTLSSNITDLFGNPLSGASMTQLVANGGFESGSFSGWTQSGDTSFTSVISGSPDGTTIHSGTHAAQIGPSGPGLGFLTQTLATTAGVTYTLDFWLSHPYSDVGQGVEWLVRVGGVTLTDVHDPDSFSYTHFTFTFTATSSATVLQFGFVEPPQYFYLDDVSVTPVSGGLTNVFTIPIVYTAAATTFQNIEIFGQAGTQALTFVGTGPFLDGAGTQNADDNYGVIDLGSNSFNFYGRTYNQLFVSSNGVITFGGGTGAIYPDTRDSRFNPALAYIAVYWTDLIKTGTEPMIVWRIDSDLLTIEWYHVQPYPSGTSMTFQAILQLNTGGTPGDIVLNYSSVTGLGSSSSDAGVTVGIKDVGTASDVARLLVEIGTHFSSTGDPRVQTGRALRFTAS